MKYCYALLLAMALAMPSPAQQTYPVQFNFGTEFFPENYSEVRQSFIADPGEAINGRVVRFLQCYHIPASEARAALEKEGVWFLAYVRSGSYLISMPEHFDAGKLAVLEPRSLVAVKPEWKIAKSLREQPFGEWAVHGNLIDVNVQVYPHVSISQGADYCRTYGFLVLSEGNQNGFLQVRMAADSVFALAGKPWVQALELASPPGEPEDTRSRALHRSNILDNAHPSGLKFNGTEDVVLVRDDGPLGPHIDFKGRLFNQTEFGADGTHGDGVAGILAGAGNLDPSVRGMAAGADIFAIRYTPDFQDQTLALHLDKNVTITNTSYSNGCNAGYTLAAQTVDQQLYDHPALMHVFSAGNSNNISNCLSYGAGNQWGNITGGHKMAKNAIVAANITPDAALVASSSRGPAYDGRLKPDISATGNDQESTDYDNSYFTFGGTSASAPGIAGVLAQLTQAYESLHNGEQPNATLLKAAVLNAANDLGNKGPDFKFGWGHVNAWRAYRLLEQNNHLEAQVDHGGQNSHHIQMPAGVRQARVMICWADPPAWVNASRALLNDLDIRVIAPDGTSFAPWKLNPAPSPGILDMAAGKGRDSLNNLEQVAIDDPAAGTYTVVVDGAEVPLGPQHYFLTWDFITDEVKLTYPAGGEGFVPGEVERIHWDAYGNQGIFSLRYSLDDGFSWQQIADVPGDQRMFDWQVPDVVSGRIRVMVQRGLWGSATAAPLSITPVPENLQIEKVCPHSMTVSWKSAKDTLPSDVYLLSNKYMEIVGTTASNTYTFPVQNGGTEKWVSVRARDGNGLAGRRAVAVRWPGELKNCKQPDDLGVRELVSPDGTPLFACAPFDLPVTVRLYNEGVNAISGAVLHYRVNDQPVVSQPLPAMAPGSTLPFTFQSMIHVSDNQQINLEIWSTYLPEDAFFNDTLRLSFPALAAPAKGYFTEGFEGGDFPPFGWRVPPPDGTLTWLETAQNITGANGLPTRALALYSFYYFGIGEENYFDMIPLDLGGIQSPGLTFQVAHAQRDDLKEQLRVEVYPACNLSASPVVIWQKSDPELGTTEKNGFSFVPNEATDWRTEAVSLGQFAGQKIIIRFVGTNDAGNNTYIDNIGIAKYDLSQPSAMFSVSADSICLSDSITLVAAPTGGNFTNYDWFFGITALPPGAVGPGPHEVRFLTAGNKALRLIASNTVGADTLVRFVQVEGSPSANFNAQPSGLKVTFTDNSFYAQSHQWNFGDGQTSAEANPVHVYAAPGTYSPKLTVINGCDMASKSIVLALTTTGAGVPEEQISGLQIVPNPTGGDFRVLFDSKRRNTLIIRLSDMQGRVIKTLGMEPAQGRNTVSFEGLELPPGLYQLQVQTADGVRVIPLAVQ